MGINSLRDYQPEPAPPPPERPPLLRGFDLLRVLERGLELEPQELPTLERLELLLREVDRLPLVEVEVYFTGLLEGFGVYFGGFWGNLGI